MVTLQADYTSLGTVTLNFSVGILTNQYLPCPEKKREGWEKHSTQMASKQQGYSKDTLRRTASKQLCIQVTRCPC